MSDHPLPKVSLGAYYDDKSGRCTSVDVSIDRDLSRADLVDLIRMVIFPAGVTHGDPRQAATEIIPKVRANEQTIAGSEFWNGSKR